MPDRELTEAILEVVRQRMDEQGLSARTVAGRLGWPDNTLSRKLRGVGDFTVDELDALAVLLGGNGLEDLVEQARRHL